YRKKERFTCFRGYSCGAHRSAVNYTLSSYEKTYKLLRYRKKSRCEGSDSNARTPTRPGSQP
ncbi:hypothetical protein, partial [Methanosarcina mazei]|uniref:hypothetical protein n=1 Tax=Methanosarcina mazei TaxID=2209 RepID=UPI001F2D0553